MTIGGAGCTSPPQPPLDFDYQLDSGVLRLSWIAGAGPAPTGYLLQAGTTPGLANIISLLLGPVPSIAVPGVPPGVDLAAAPGRERVRCQRAECELPAAGRSRTPAPPLEPLGFTGTASGGVVHLSWVEPPYLTPTS